MSVSVAARYPAAADSVVSARVRYAGGAGSLPDGGHLKGIQFDAGNNRGSLAIEFKRPSRGIGREGSTGALVENNE